MAEGNTGNPKKEFPNDLSVTISNRTSSRDRHTTPRLELDPRKKSYENKTPSEPAATTEESNSDITPPEQADPTETVSTEEINSDTEAVSPEETDSEETDSEETDSDTNEENINIPRMPLRTCKAVGCTYEVGQDGDLPEGPEGQLRDLEVHLITCPFVIKSKKVVKDQKIPIYVPGQSFESWLQDYTLWKDNVGYRNLLNVLLLNGPCISKHEINAFAPMLRRAQNSLMGHQGQRKRDDASNVFSI